MAPINPMLSSPSFKSRLGVRREILGDGREMSIIALFNEDTWRPLSSPKEKMKMKMKMKIKMKIKNKKKMKNEK